VADCKCDDGYQIDPALVDKLAANASALPALLASAYTTGSGLCLACPAGKYNNQMQGFFFLYVVLARVILFGGGDSLHLLRDRKVLGRI